MNGYQGGSQQQQQVGGQRVRGGYGGSWNNRNWNGWNGGRGMGFNPLFLLLGVFAFFFVMKSFGFFGLLLLLFVGIPLAKNAFRAWGHNGGGRSSWMKDWMGDGEKGKRDFTSPRNYDGATDADFVDLEKPKRQRFVVGEDGELQTPEGEPPKRDGGFDYV